MGATPQQLDGALVKRDPAAIMERLITTGDLSKLSAAERVTYYERLCESLELNPLTRPFEYLTLSGKLVLYARKDCAEQLRKKQHISIYQLDERQDGDLYVVTAHARTPDGREDMDMGAVSTASLRGDNLVNARLKAVTKAKRRVTLSICGLGMLDETEIETIPGARHTHVDDEGQLAGVREAEADEAAPARPATNGRLGKFHKRINELRGQIISFGAETETVLNEMLGALGCERVEELDLSQAEKYGRQLSDIYEQHVAGTVDASILDEEPPY